MRIRTREESLPETRAPTDIAHRDLQLLQEGAIRLLFHRKRRERTLLKEYRSEWEQALSQLLGVSVALEPYDPSELVFRIYPLIQAGSNA